MHADANGVPDPSQIEVVERAADLPVALQVGPGGDIFYAAISGSIRRIAYSADLTARATADTTSGEPGLTVQFDGSGSSDPAGAQLSYAWDLDGDGAFDDSTEVRPQRTYARGVYPVRLQVSDGAHRTAVSAPIVVVVGERPHPTITAPAPGAPWKAGQRIAFAGTATDDQDGALPAQAMKWRIILLHCPMGGCHQHPFETFEGVSGGSFVADPDGYPAHFVVELTATDSNGLTGTTSVQIDAIGTQLSLQTSPPGLSLLYTGTPMVAPVQVTEVAGYAVTIEAPSPQELDGASYVFTGWSDGGERAHVLAVPDQARTYLATYELDTDRDGVVDSKDPCPLVPGTACSGGGQGGCSCAGAAHPGTGS